MARHDDAGQLPPTAVMARMLDRFLLSRALFVLAEAGDATVLPEEGPHAVAALAERTGSDADALAGLIRSVTPLGATLSEKHPQSMHGIAVGGGHLRYRAVAEFGRRSTRPPAARCGLVARLLVVEQVVPRW